MYYWRDEYFGILSATAKLLGDHPDWYEYSQYCKLLEQGLRKQAQAHLTSFIDALSSQPFLERKRFVSWICNYCYNNAAAQLLIPYPLQKRLVEPTLIEWAGHDLTNSEPYRWLGTESDLKKAISLNPDDEVAIIKLAEMILNGVAYSTHDLPYGYLGNPKEDLTALDEVEVAVQKLKEGGKRETYLGGVRKLRGKVREYLNARTATD
jgi:hypothetical protein